MNTAVIPGKDLETRLALLDSKLDIVLEELNAQKRGRQQVEDLMSDLSIIGKDMFETTVYRLDKAGIEFDGYNLEKLVLKVIRNINTFNTLIEFLESSNDFIKDISPVIRQVGLDLINKLHSLEEKGYFVFFNEFLNILDQIVTHFTKEDLRALADNVVSILETMKNLTQPDILKSVDNAVSGFKNLDMDNIEEVSLWKALRIMNSKDGKRAMGFIMTFLLNLINNTKQNNKT
jgi:uncharacterized protein YjgD (DUF1641 family)